MISNSKIGTVYWFTGLSGAGKTTIGKLFFLRQKKSHKSIFLDGDELRKIFGEKFGYSITDRKYLAFCYSKFCQMLSSQGFDVICCTISMFNEVRKYNRLYLKNYKEVYIKVSKEILIKRNQKKLYKHSNKNIVKDVVGMDQNFEEPIDPDIIITNDGDQTPEKIIEKFYEKIKVN